MTLPATASAQPNLFGRGMLARPLPTVADGVPGRLVIGLADDAALDRVVDRHDLRVVNYLGELRAAAVAVTRSDEADVLAGLRADADVAWAEPDVKATATHADCAGEQLCPLPNDPHIRRQWYLQNDTRSVPPPGAVGATLGADIDAPSGWQRGVGSAAVRVAIVDSGVDLGHPDLAGRVVSASTLVSNIGDVTDYTGHGTFIAGIVGAAWNNGLGIAGIVPNSALMIMKDTDDANGDQITASAIAGGIVSAVDGGAQVINVSQGSSTYSTVIHNAVNYAWNHNALVVVSAGNDGSSVVTYPAAEPNAISVGATNVLGQRAAFSNYGTWVLATAPGQGIFSTQPTYSTTLFSAPAGDPASTAYTYADGTSFAAPMVAAVAAMIWPTVTDTNHNGYVNDEVVTRLLTTTDPDRTPGSSRFGAINLCQALAEGRVGVCPVPAPPAAATAPLLPPGPVPATDQPTVSRMPAGVWTGRLRRPAVGKLRFTIPDGGVQVKWLKARIRLRCGGGHAYVLDLSTLHRPLTLDADGSFAVNAQGRSHSRLKNPVFYVRGRLRSNRTATGTVRATGATRQGAHRCSSGTVRWTIR